MSEMNLPIVPLPVPQPITQPLPAMPELPPMPAISMQPMEPPALRIDPTNPRAIAKYFLAASYLSPRGDPGGSLMLAYHLGEFWRWDRKKFVKTGKEGIEAAVSDWLSIQLTTAVDKDGNLKNDVAKPNIKLIAEVLAAIKLSILIPDEIDAPCWMGSGVVARPNPKNVTALRNGLLDVEAYLRGAPYEQYFIQHTPQFFNLVSADFDFAPSAPTPTELLRFLATVFPGDQASIDLLQEWFGYCQVSDVHLQKMMLLWGITRSGKGVLAELLENLLGKASVIPMKLSDFGSSGGLWAAMTSSLGIFYDARISKWADSSAAVETLLSVAAGEPQCVNRKFLKPVKVSLPTRLMVISNELPQVSDTSGALAGRFLILHFTQSFLHREDHGITARCLRELPSILLWSLEGLRRLRTNDRFTVPASSLESHQDLMETISPVTGFVSDRCTLDPEARVEESVLFAEYIKWCTAQNQLRPGTCKSFASKLTTSSGVSKYRGSDGLGRPRMFRGIRVGTTPIFAIAATPSM